MPCDKLIEFLVANGVTYQLVEHAQAFTAQEIADKAHVSGRRFAKTVMVRLDGRMAMAVLPASEKVSLALLEEVTGARDARLATERDFKDLFPDCELGAMPPFGNLYGMEVYASAGLAEAEEIAFNAGRHTEVLTMRYADFERLARPKVALFSHHRPLERED